MKTRTGWLFLPLILLAAPAWAETRWAFGLGAGWHRFDSNFGGTFQGDPTLTASDAVQYGGRASATWGPGFGLELAGGWSPTWLQQSGRDVARLHASFYTLNLVFDPEPKGWGAPYLGAGGGAGIYYVTDPEPGFDEPWIRDGEEASYPGFLDLSGGWTFRLGGPVRLRLEARHQSWLTNEAGPFESSTPRTWTFGAVLTLRSGAAGRDEDADGVSDANDRCPATPAGARVDRTGCPLDGDRDGVLDGLDFCPQSPAGALVDERGCGKDTDRDGVVDGIDRCPSTPRRCAVTEDGCPVDADGDGVCDAIDRCSNTPRGWSVNDEGCPSDADRDGVPDGGDQCPGTPAGAKVDGNGCPLELGQMEMEMVTTGRVKIPILFATGRDHLTAEHDPVLDRVALLLSRWPGYRFEITAHPGTREGGGAKLGDRRARAIRDDLVRRSPAVDGLRLTARGVATPRAASTRYPSPVSASIQLVANDRSLLRREAERRGLIKPAPPPAKPAPARTSGSSTKSTRRR
jgi:outer membrane protein OmpA-like peptidoglycan-associated protein